MEAVTKQAELYLAQLDKELSKYPLAVEAEKKTKVPKTYLAVGASSIILILVFFNIWGDLITNLIGFLYPAYQSFKAIESSNKEDDAQWLTYWTVFGFLNIIEFFTDTILFWVPFYHTFKAGLLLYLFLPHFQGASLIYSKVLRPYLVSSEKGIDAELSKVKAKATSAVSGI
ncbi:hypothetical protein HK096_008700, partial [Nowakowskiella sp. JEL0078]